MVAKEFPRKTEIRFRLKVNSFEGFLTHERSRIINFRIPFEYKSIVSCIIFCLVVLLLAL